MLANDKHAPVLRWILRRSRQQLFSMVLLVVANMLLAVSTVVFAITCREIIDGAVGGDRSRLYRGIALLLGVILTQLALRLFCNGLLEYTKARLEILFKDSLFSHLLQADYKQMTAYHCGELLNRMFSDVQVVTDGVTGLLPNFISMITRLAAAFGVLVWLYPVFALVFLCAGVFIFCISRLLRKRLKALHRAVQEREGRVRSFFQETLSSVLIVKVFGAYQKTEQEAQVRMHDHYKARMKRRNLSIVSNAGFTLVFQLGYAYALVSGALGILGGTMSYGTLTAVLQLVGQVQTPFAGLSGMLPRFYGVLASAERIMELEQLPQEADQPLPALEPADFRGIAFEHVQFSYGRNDVLQNLNFSIDRGDFVAVTGRSGVGKSTVFLLMLGVYAPQGGKVRILTNAGEYPACRSTRRLFSYVPQGNILFSGTVRDNISFVKPEASESEIWRAAETACAADFIRQFPQGLDTQIGENGFGLSLGQAQRIAVARAVLSDAPVILFDEATSALDEATELTMLHNIAIIRNKTCVIVTHRKAALQICNKRLHIGGVTVNDKVEQRKENEVWISE